MRGAPYVPKCCRFPANVRSDFGRNARRNSARAVAKSADLGQWPASRCAPLFRDPLSTLVPAAARTRWAASRILRGCGSRGAAIFSPATTRPTARLGRASARRSRSRWHRRFSSACPRVRTTTRCITYFAEASDTLAAGSWTAAVQDGAPIANGDGTENVFFRDTLPRGTGPRFIRLKITQP